MAEREAGPAIEKCSKDANRLLADLNKLSQNKESATQTANKITVLATNSSGRAARGRGRRAVPTNCAELLAKVKVIAEKLEANSKADVSTEVAEINKASLEAGDCSNNAVELKNIKARLDKVVDDIGSLIKHLQQQLASKLQYSVSITVFIRLIAEFE